MKPIALILILFLVPTVTLADDLDSLYCAIDDAIGKKDVYLSQKERRLDSLRALYINALNDENRYQIALKLYDEYRPYRNDSATSYLNRCISLSERLQHPDLKAICLCKLGLQYSMSGFYPEALNYLGDIPRNELSDSLLPDYYYAMNHLYGEMASYTPDYALSRIYYKKSDSYGDSLLAVIPREGEMYLNAVEQEFYKAHDYDSALIINDKRLLLTPKGSHGYAKVSYQRAMDFGGKGDTAQMKIFLAQSALCDLKNSVMDQASLWSLADILSAEGDVERSHRYVEYSWECNSRFSSHVRSWLVSPVLTTINDKYKLKLNNANTSLRVLVAIVSLLAVLLGAMLFYVSRKRRQLAIARNELKASNDSLTVKTQQLSDANLHLSQLNSELTSLNLQLGESNSIKEEYIGKFFTLCSEYIDKLDQYRIMVKRRVKAKQFEELHRIVQNEDMKTEELAVLFDNFDNIFLHLFPNFLDGFNALLKPEHRYQSEPDGKLHTDVRIFALIRLGIEDSSKIAEFLHYSPNTIYNYRARLKAKAIDREHFEEEIKKIAGEV